MRISLGDVSLLFDVSGPSVVPQGDTTAERPVLLAVHRGPGLDHMTVKSALGPLAEDFQVVYFDLRGHGRSDHSSAEFWNVRTWADDLRRLCDALGLRQPVVLGSSFGANVVLTYPGLFPDHPAAVILANTNGGHTDQQRVIEAFGRLGGARLQVAISSACRTGLAEPAEQVTGPLGGGRRPSAACGRPRVNDLDAGAIEVRQVASGKYRAAGAADGGDKSVETSDRLPSSLVGTGNNRVLLSSSCIDWQDLLIEGPEGVVRGI